MTVKTTKPVKKKKSIKSKARLLLAVINHDLYEREEVIKLTLLAAIAGESIFLYPPNQIY